MENGPRPSVAKQQPPPPEDRQRNATIAEGARPRGADKSASSDGLPAEVIATWERMGAAHDRPRPRPRE